MNITKTIGIAAIIAASGVTAYSVAAPDYERIKKDINVMIGIVKSSFNNNDDCHQCKVKITGHYLADQGVVFNVDPSNQYHYSYEHYDDGVTKRVFAIPGMVEEIIEDVQIRIGDGDFDNWDFHMENNWGDWNDTDREAREEMRAARHEIRELAREIRELEMERIHASGDELSDIEARKLELEEEIARRESRHEKIVADMNSHSDKRRAERESRRARMMDEQRERFEQMESVVLDAFCDYSSTMRNLPNNEKVSIVVKKSGNDANIYVFEQKKLADCDSSKDNVRQHALSYAF